MIKKWYLRLQESVWFIPGSYSFFALILSVIALSVDTIYANNVHKWLPYYLLTDVELAQTILSALAPSLLTMTTITFSMIMVVLTTYTSQFSPRTLQNFITERRTLRVLGIFIGGFIYTILALLFMRKSEEEQVVFSAVLGVAISILCLGYFVYFIHHVATSLRVSKLIENLSIDILETVHKLHQENKDKTDVEYTSPSAQILDVLKNKPIEIPPLKKGGYIQLIDLEGLRNEAKQCHVVMKVNRPIGTYVGPATPMLLMWPQSIEIENTNRFLDYITVGESRTTFQDMEYGIQKLIEIALRAVSPGINDPNTAITCIKSCGNILHEISKTHLGTMYHYDEENQLRLIVEYPRFEDLLYSTFYQLRHYSKEDVSVTASILDALIFIAEGANQSIKNKVWHFSDYIISGFNSSMLQELDKTFLNKKLDQLAQAAHTEQKPNHF